MFLSNWNICPSCLLINVIKERAMSGTESLRSESESESESDQLKRISCGSCFFQYQSGQISCIQSIVVLNVRLCSAIIVTTVVVRCHCILTSSIKMN